ncbi:hypothetical protein Goari_023188 [Gossypium aridum]|uniref:RRM domain-containing protein n=1 Tax=Gossypium aridum TaxID=34290 RepID=A0A7J8X2N9_GOSAI|nr:hypothetical protein [Gossypium aridum]
MELMTKVSGKHSLDSVTLLKVSCIARVIADRDTGRSRGFGFVNFADDESASNALSAMDGQELQGRNIRVSYANERPSGPRSFGNNGGFGGSRGFGGGSREDSSF